jgi:UDP-GlcNAc:undecaprenyl-phosphate/decaprenyl-phosphate GlcNAc-1-phosphate transferase
VLWVVGMANAINLIDGLDGLAAGIVAIAAGAFFLYADRLGRPEGCSPSNVGPLLAVIVLGVCVGFLPHNFHPARIFMGDGGALLLGLLMAGHDHLVGGNTDRALQRPDVLLLRPAVIPLVILGVPILDTAFAIVRRARRRKGRRHRRQGPPAPPADAPRPRAAAQRADPVGLDRAAVGVRAVPDLHRPGDAIVPIGIAALALVLYTVLHPRWRGTPDGPVAADAAGGGTDATPAGHEAGTGTGTGTGTVGPG